jgi:hypothetical protein
MSRPPQDVDPFMAFRREMNRLLDDVFIDTFPNDAGRQSQFSNRVAAALRAIAAELLARPPRVDVAVASPPEQRRVR